jgi:uncharacterized protein YbdZ (MbtH family)
MTIFEVWEWDGTALNASGWRVDIFSTREKAQACVDSLENDWNTREIREVHVK